MKPFSPSASHLNKICNDRLQGVRTGVYYIGGKELRGFELEPEGRTVDLDVDLGRVGQEEGVQVQAELDEKHRGCRLGWRVIL